GIFFDWKNQADSIINGVRLSDEERARSRVMLVDASHKHHPAASALFVAQAHAVDDRIRLIFPVKENPDHANY
ncbi:hypothetical protein QCD79_34335, partial [Pseudomonas quasicaspiana]|nr:hypothetical protein [Pseudomonas quasicaspiana]